ncbi:MAG: response regulator [Deltaproteobacteria bacterium]|nr:response regulator [Deltaproteobacteria bacterium]
MSIISIFSGTYCQADQVAQKVAETFGYKLIDDATLVADAAGRFHISESKLWRTINGKVSVFNKFTHERERCAADLKVVLADLLKTDGLVLHGFLTHFIPREISHVLKVCLIAETPFRVAKAVADKGITEAEAQKLVHKDNEAAYAWTDYLGHKVPWDADLYDILLPMDKLEVSGAVDLIVANAKKKVLQPTAQSLTAVDDFLLAAHVGVALAQVGHEVGVTAKDSHITLTIDKHVLLLSRLEDELKKIASGLSGVKSVETKVGPGFYQSDIYRKYDFEMPAKVLLVDDERDFAQTLSERLQMRDVGSAVVYDGAQALDLLQDDEPEVMVLDLNMPGMNGIEVLRQVKSQHPKVQVIILTGHGSKDDERVCLDLGAFAYLEKPVDIELLAKTMRQANQKAQECKE